MNKYQQYSMVPDCPQCGAKDEFEQWKGARFGPSSAWNHKFACCSEKCGLLFEKNPKRLLMEIGLLQEQERSLKIQLDDLKDRYKKEIEFQSA